MRRWVLVVLVLVACRTGGGTRARPGRDGDVTPASTPATSPDGAVPAVERCAGGEPWNGVPSGCAYEVDGCCYRDAETACGVAKCAAEACEVLETYPAQVRCTTS